jgi:hypothetical protein
MYLGFRTCDNLHFREFVEYRLGKTSQQLNFLFHSLAHSDGNAEAT